MTKSSKLPVNIELSQRIGQKAGAQVGKCYSNAWRALQVLPELDGACYVEGCVVESRTGRIEERGWLELDERIVDPTLYRAELAYFPGLCFDKEAAAKAINEIPKPEGTEDLPLFRRFGQDGMDNPNFRRCREAALLAATEILGGGA